jgi:hypothetical protein
MMGLETDHEREIIPVDRHDLAKAVMRRPLPAKKGTLQAYPRIRDVLGRKTMGTMNLPRVFKPLH